MFSSAESILNSLASSYGFETILLEDRLRRDWGNLVGDSIASHTRPEKIRFRKLHIIVENSVWLQQLTFLKPTLLEKIHGGIQQPLLKDIVFRVGVLPEKHPPFPHLSSPMIPPSDPEAVLKGTLCANCVKDPELRVALSRVIAKSLSQ